MFACGVHPASAYYKRTCVTGWTRWTFSNLLRDAKKRLLAMSLFWVCTRTASMVHFVHPGGRGWVLPGDFGQAMAVGTAALPGRLSFCGKNFTKHLVVSCAAAFCCRLGPTGQEPAPELGGERCQVSQRHTLSVCARGCRSDGASGPAQRSRATGGGGRRSGECSSAVSRSASNANGRDTWSPPPKSTT